MEPNAHIHPKPEAGKAFFQQYQDKGKVVMLNLLKFREIADYSRSPELTPEKEISGKEAYDRYAQHVFPLLQKAGGKVLFYGNSGDFLIGPESEKWDTVILVEHESAVKFVAFSQDEAYLEIAGHRTAALADSRLLPIVQRT
ncbi:MAG: DUF1330 domain-containing protein [Bacteroidota bacterium]